MFARPLSTVVCEARNAGHAVAVKVLRLVCQLMEVRVCAGGKEGYWNVDAVVLRVVAATEHFALLSHR